MDGLFGGFFTTLMEFLKVSFKWILDGSIYCLKFVLYFVFDGLLTAFSAIISAIDVSGLGLTAVMSWVSLPPQLIYLINACGIPQGLAVVVSAILMRMALNLIPAAVTRI